MEWTDERCERLKQVHAERLSGGKIASLLTTEFQVHITRSAIIGKVQRMGLGPIGGGRKQAQPGAHLRSRKRKTVRRISNYGNRFKTVEVNEPDAIPETPLCDTKIPLHQRRGLHELNAFTCRWPVGNPDKPDFFFCGAIPKPGRPYCHAHCARAYSRVRADPLGWEERQRRRFLALKNINRKRAAA